MASSPFDPRLLALLVEMIKTQGPGASVGGSIGGGGIGGGIGGALGGPTGAGGMKQGLEGAQSAGQQMGAPNPDALLGGSAMRQMRFHVPMEPVDRRPSTLLGGSVMRQVGGGMGGPMPSREEREYMPRPTSEQREYMPPPSAVPAGYDYPLPQAPQDMGAVQNVGVQNQAQLEQYWNAPAEPGSQQARWDLLAQYLTAVAAPRGPRNAPYGGR